LSESKPEMVGICGVYCGLCPVFDVRCPGCLKDPASKECPLYICALENAVRFCFQCNKFPCQTHYEKGIYKKEALDSWKKMKKE